jgi:hypothetical protein
MTKLCELFQITDAELEELTYINDVLINRENGEQISVAAIVEELQDRREQVKELVALLPAEHESCDDNWYSCELHPDYRGRDLDKLPDERHCTCGLDRINETLERLGIKR